LHPPLELHNINDDKVTNTVSGIDSEFLGEDEIVVAIKQLGNWPEESSNCLKGREPKTEESRQLGVVSKIVYLEIKDFQKLHLLIMKRDYVDDFIACARKPAQTTKGKGQIRVEAKGAGKSQAHNIISKEKKKQSKNKSKWFYADRSENVEVSVDAGL